MADRLPQCCRAAEPFPLADPNRRTLHDPEDAKIMLFK